MSNVAEELEDLYAKVQSVTDGIHMPSFLKDLFQGLSDSKTLSGEVRDAIVSEERTAKKIILRMQQNELAGLAQKLDDAESLLTKLEGFDAAKARASLSLPPIAVIGPQAHQLIQQLVGLELRTE